MPCSWNVFGLFFMASAIAFSSRCVTWRRRQIAGETGRGQQWTIGYWPVASLPFRIWPKSVRRWGHWSLPTCRRPGCRFDCPHRLATTLSQQIDNYRRLWREDWMSESHRLTTIALLLTIQRTRPAIAPTHDWIADKAWVRAQSHNTQIWLPMGLTSLSLSRILTIWGGERGLCEACVRLEWGWETSTSLHCLHTVHTLFTACQWHHHSQTTAHRPVSHHMAWPDYLPLVTYPLWSNLIWSEKISRLCRKWPSVHHYSGLAKGDYCNVHCDRAIIGRISHLFITALYWRKATEISEL